MNVKRIDEYIEILQFTSASSILVTLMPLLGLRQTNYNFTAHYCKQSISKYYRESQSVLFRREWKLQIMASSEATDSRTNSLTNRSTSSVHNDEDSRPNELTGWLMKRTKISRKWKKQWFVLKNTNLQYGSAPESTVKEIPLTNAEISETTIDKKPFAFSIKCKEKGRTYYIQADTESSQNNWMQAICFAKAAGQHGDNSATCVIQ